MVTIPIHASANLLAEALVGRTPVAIVTMCVIRAPRPVSAMWTVPAHDRLNFTMDSGGKDNKMGQDMFLYKKVCMSQPKEDINVKAVW